MGTSGQAKQRQRARATRDLLCLLASYDAYGSGAAWPLCLGRLAGAGGPG
jgi:hypothetical protein